MNPETINWSAIREIAEIQRERKSNWHDNRPRDAKLEEHHRARLDALRAQLSADRPAAEGASEAPAGMENNRGVGAMSAGNLLTRFFKRFSR